MITRYSDATIDHIWSRRNQLNLWTEVERAWMRQLSEVAWIDACSAMAPRPQEVEEREQYTRHEFVAFLDVWSDRFSSDEAQRWVHYGLTSSDVIDTATAIQLYESHTYLQNLANELLGELEKVTTLLGGMLQVGRTHGQWAQPRQAKNPMFVLWLMAFRQASRMTMAGAELRESDFSGATGGRELANDDAVHAALDSLGLRRAMGSTQILPRDGWVHWAHTVAGLVTVCEAIADHYWHLAQSEVGEVEVVNGAGSSAMPHKRGNPHLAENVRGLARLARGLSSTLDESMVQRGDRDLAHNSVERVALPDLIHLAATALKRTIAITHDYQYAPERVEANLTEALNVRVDSALVQAGLVEAGASRRDAIEETRKENNSE